jgi:hypothetical protein
MTGFITALHISVTATSSQMCCVDVQKTYISQCITVMRREKLKLGKLWCCARWIWHLEVAEIPAFVTLSTYFATASGGLDAALHRVLLQSGIGQKKSLPGRFLRVRDVGPDRISSDQTERAAPPSQRIIAPVM